MVRSCASMAPIGAKLRQNAFRTIYNFRFFDAEKVSEKYVFDFFTFSSVSTVLGGARDVRMSKSDSSRYLTSGAQIFGSVGRFGWST